jgi:hypothetical protein
MPSDLGFDSDCPTINIKSTSSSSTTGSLCNTGVNCALNDSDFLHPPVELYDPCVDQLLKSKILPCVVDSVVKNKILPCVDLCILSVNDSPLISAVETFPQGGVLDTVTVELKSGVTASESCELSDKHSLGLCPAARVSETIDTLKPFFKGTSMVNSPLTCSMRACITAWETELEGDPQSEYILDGIRNGFKLTDQDFEPVSVLRKNYLSASVTNKVKSEGNIKVEIQKGRYIVVPNKPLVVSSIGAVPKPNLDVRLIHDLSRPHGGVNAFSLDNSVSYSSISDATKLIKDGSFLAKMDLSSAYRSVPISPESFNLTGLQWTFTGDSEPTYMYDCRLPFGASKSCKIFTAVSDAVTRFFAKRG